MNQIEITADQLTSQQAFLSDLIQDLPSELPTLEISEHAESKRIMPPGTTRPGPLDLSWTPYLIEPMNNMSPFSPIQRTIVIKGAQGGWTMGCENIVMYYMDHAPADQLFISATEGSIERWATRRLEPAIDSYGMRDSIYSQFGNEKNRRTGDKVYSKEYHGCRLDMVSAKSDSSQRSMDKRILTRDEIDSIELMANLKEGSFLARSYARTNSYGNRRKVFDLSTPVVFETSLIYPEYLSGDRRIFMIPCPICGEFQALDSAPDIMTNPFKLLPMRDEKGYLIDAYFECVKCKEPIREFKKPDFMAKGFWKPTAEPSSKEIRSYHWPAVYSPLGMISWREIYQIYEIAQKAPEKMAAFNNLQRGIPHKEIGGRPKLQKLLEQVGTYRSGDISMGVLFLTMSVDVQLGSKTVENNPARLEIEVLGHGYGMRTWSIMRKIFLGSTENPYQGAWKKFSDWMKEGGLVFERTDKMVFDVAVIFIDSGTLTDVVYQFCVDRPSTYPIKGTRILKRKDHEKRDEAGPANFTRYRVSKTGNDLFVTISTNFYKSRIYRGLDIKRKNQYSNPNGFFDHPADYTDEYFKGLTVEEKMQDGSFRCPSGARNEPLDLKVYNLCAGDFYLDNCVHRIKANAVSEGISKAEIDKIDKKFFLNQLMIQTGNEIEETEYFKREKVKDRAD